MISYQTQNLSSADNDSFFGVLAECKTHFDEQNINILGEGYTDIVANENLWEDYKDLMLKGTDADEAEELGQLFENSRVSTLTESVSGIQPISSLSVPTIRKLWPRMSLKNAIPTDVVKIPKFSVSYLLPYILSGGKKHYLPEALTAGGSAENAVTSPALYQEVIKLADFDAGNGVVTGANGGFDLLASVEGTPVASKTIGDSIDADFIVSAIEMEVTDKAGNKTLQLVEGLQIGTGLDGSIFYEVSAIAAADAGVPGAPVTKDVLIGNVNREAGVLILACTGGKVTGAKIIGRLVSEFNTRSDSVSFDIKNRDVTIGTGAHLNAPLPLEFLQDLMAMYNIDGTAKIVDIMTKTLALKLDTEIRNFLLEAFKSCPTYRGKFDCKPLAQFAGTPKEWREMLKDVIDHQCQRLKQDHNYTNGKFVIIGNEMDTQLIPNVSWAFSSSNTERSGVEVDYRLGAVSGALNYEVVSSPSIPKGALYVIFTSEADEQMTYKYYPYTFNMMMKESGYSDPNHPHVPSLACTKRHKLEKFKDSMIRIEILNNDGNPSFN